MPWPERHSRRTPTAQRPSDVACGRRQSCVSTATAGERERERERDCVRPGDVRGSHQLAAARVGGDLEREQLGDLPGRPENEAAGPGRTREWKRPGKHLSLEFSSSPCATAADPAARQTG